MEKLIINNKRIRYNEYLAQAELSLFSLTLKQRIKLLFLEHIFISRYKPAGFTAPVNFYLVKYKSRYFISYPQGWERVFYYPEAST